MRVSEIRPITSKNRFEFLDGPIVVFNKLLLLSFYVIIEITRSIIIVL